MDDIAIKVEHVSKTFKLPHEKNSSVKGALLSLVKGGKRTFERQEVLKDISFEIKKGEFFGIVGRNGSGKSTLLKLLAGIYSPTKGNIQVNGKLTPFIELGVGFNPELTGRENVFLNGALLGFNRKEMEAMYGDIVVFAELEKFMDQKLKNYSSGMQVRLAFSIAIRAKSDILLIDEVLAVGDLNFQAKCFEVFRQMKKEGRTVIFVSHDLASLQEFCTRAVLIDQGEQRLIGDINEVVIQYQVRMATAENNAEEVNSSRPGSGEVRISDVKLLNDKDETVDSIEVGVPFTIAISYTQKKALKSMVCGLEISDPGGISLVGPNTKEANFHITEEDIRSSSSLKAHFKINVLSPGDYRITVGIFDERGIRPIDYYNNAKTFKIIGKARHGKTTTEPTWSFSKASK